jgi:pSer/pThr/pTyr-binding forkhead associated (FHA) protein
MNLPLAVNNYAQQAKPVISEIDKKSNMKVRFTHLTGAMTGSVEEFALPIIRVGRALSSDLLLQDDAGKHRLASRMHAEFRVEGEQVVLYDLSSRNGTYINGQPIDRQVLADGDQVSFGFNGISFQVSFVVAETEDLEFLRTTALFKELSSEILQKIYYRGQVENYPAGALLFHRAEPVGRLYIVRNGIVELRTYEKDNQIVTSYLGPGQTIGETGVFLEEESRAEAQVPEGAEIFSITSERLQELMRNTAMLAEHFVVTFARYINHTQKRRALQARTKLRGSLLYFKLPTIIQTLVVSRESGVLTISAVNSNLARSMNWDSSLGVLPIGQVFLEDGTIRGASVGKLNGKEAFWQLFQLELSGTFSFEQEAQFTPNSSAEWIAPETPRALLLEALRLQEEMVTLKSRFPNEMVAFQLVSHSLRSQHKSDEIIVQLVEDLLLERPVALIELLDLLPCCYWRIYRVMYELLESYQVRLVKIAE